MEYQGIEGILIFKRILVEQCKREEGGTINIATKYVYIYVQRERKRERERESTNWYKNESKIFNWFGRYHN